METRGLKTAFATSQAQTQWECRRNTATPPKDGNIRNRLRKPQTLPARKGKNSSVSKQVSGQCLINCRSCALTLLERWQHLQTVSPAKSKEMHDSDCVYTHAYIFMWVHACPVHVHIEARGFHQVSPLRCHWWYWWWWWWWWWKSTSPSHPHPTPKSGAHRLD